MEVSPIQVITVNGNKVLIVNYQKVPIEKDLTCIFSIVIEALYPCILPVITVVFPPATMPCTLHQLSLSTITLQLI